MQSLFERTLGRLVTAPPMPLEAVPAGLLGKLPAAHEALEQAWRTMFLTALTQGAILGVLGAVVVLLAVLIRSNLRGALQGAIRDALHQ